MPESIVDDDEMMPYCDAGRRMIRDDPASEFFVACPYYGSETVYLIDEDVELYLCMQHLRLAVGKYGVKLSGPAIPPAPADPRPGRREDGSGPGSAAR